jgi:hypothetical protein
LFGLFFFHPGFRCRHGDSLTLGPERTGNRKLHSKREQETMDTKPANGRDELLERYRALVGQIVEKWAIGKPPNPSPAATSDKPSGYFRLTNYLLEYLADHRRFPAGIHDMPEGRDSLGNLEPSFPVDFDLILKGFDLP